MNKKIITLVLIVLTVINTIFWLNIIVKTVAGPEDYLTRELEKKGTFKVSAREHLKLVKGELSPYKEEAVGNRLKIMIAIQNTTTYRMVRIFEGKENTLITFLAITDTVLIAISFMIILLYKKE